MKSFKKLFFLLTILFLVSSCFEYDDISLLGIEGFKMGKIDGKRIAFSLDVKIDNPNKYALVVKPSTLDVYIEDNLIGHTTLDQKIKFIKKTEKVYTVPLHVDLEDGALLKILKYGLKDKLSLHIVGKVKGSVYGFSKRVKVDETKQISGKDLKIFSKND